MKTSIQAGAAALLVAAGGLAAPAHARSRDQIRIVGSSTVYPFTTAAAEQLGKSGQFKTPVVESTGTGGGFKLFCTGVGPGHPDASNASRAIKKSEFDDCQKNGVKDIVELNIGYDGLTVASSRKGPDLKLTKAQIFRALAKEVPGPSPPTAVAEKLRRHGHVASSVMSVFLPIGLFASRAKVEIFEGERRDACLDPGGHRQFLVETLLQWIERGRETAGLGHSDERTIGRRLKILEGEIDEGVLQYLVASHAVPEGGEVAGER